MKKKERNPMNPDKQEGNQQLIHHNETIEHRRKRERLEKENRINNV